MDSPYGKRETQEIFTPPRRNTHQFAPAVNYSLYYMSHVTCVVKIYSW